MNSCTFWFFSSFRRPGFPVSSSKAGPSSSSSAGELFELLLTTLLLRRSLPLAVEARDPLADLVAFDLRGPRDLAVSGRDSSSDGFEGLAAAFLAGLGAASKADMSTDRLEVGISPMARFSLSVPTPATICYKRIGQLPPHTTGTYWENSLCCFAHISIAVFKGRKGGLNQMFDVAKVGVLFVLLAKPQQQLSLCIGFA